MRWSDPRGWALPDYGMLPLSGRTLGTPTKGGQIHMETMAESYPWCYLTKEKEESQATYGFNGTLQAIAPSTFCSSYRIGGLFIN